MLYLPKKEKMFLIEHLLKEDDETVMKVMFVRGFVPGEALSKAIAYLAELYKNDLYYITDVRIARDSSVLEFNEYDIFTSSLGWDEEDIEAWSWD